MTTLTADRGDTWYCSCGNDSSFSGEGFTPCDEDGDECEPFTHHRCNECLFVFTESDLIREA